MTRPTTPVADEQIARAFRSLAEQHAAQREPAERRLAWNHLEHRALAGASARRGPAYVARWVVPALAAAIVLLVGAWLRQPSLDFEVSGATVKDGEIRTSAERGVVAFSDGSRVEASARTALSVSIVGQHAALTRLARGNLRVDVRHEEETDWVFLAGPYEVRVVGTKFKLGWDPDAARLSIAMLEGRVRVRGPGKLDRLLSKGEALEWPPLAPPSAPALPEPSVTATPELEQRSAEHAAPGPSRASGERSPAASPPSAESATNWSALVSSGRFEDVVDAAERAGIDGVLSARGPAELKALAHAARYTGRTALALRTWQVIRERFSGRSTAQQAAFFLGRIHDQQGRSS